MNAEERERTTPMIIEIKHDIYRYVDTLFERERQERAATLAALQKAQDSKASHSEFYFSMIVAIASLVTTILHVIGR